MTGGGRLEHPVGAGLLVLERADITTLDVDAIVNAANQHLAGGGGVDGAIHRAAGSAELQEELHRLHPDGCPTGSAVITGGFRLPARHVIHAVGPRWDAGADRDPARAREREDLLRSAYRTAFGLAATAQLRTVAAPSISTGIYGFPVERAAPIAVAEACAALGAEGTSLREVRFALFDQGTFDAFAGAVAAL